MKAAPLLSTHAPLSQNEIRARIAKRDLWRKGVNRGAYVLLLSLSGITLLPLLSVFLYLVIRGLPAFEWSFLTSLPLPIGEPHSGIGNAILGSFLMILGASCIGVPWGVLMGIFLSEYPHRNPKFSSLLRLGVDVLASVPSIIIGIFVYSLIVLPMRHFSAFAGSIALAIIMIPTVARGVEEILKRVPIPTREAGLALGLPRWKVIFFILVWGSKKPLMTSFMLSIARISGETAPLLFTCLNNRFWSWAWNQPMASLPVQIYTDAVSPYPEWHQKAWGAALFLVCFIFFINLATRFVFRSPDAPP